MKFFFNTTLLLLLVLAHTGTTLECYRCNGDDMCHTKVQCEGSCAKEHDFDEDDDVRRYCSTVKEQDGNRHPGEGKDEDIRVFFCNTDLCNGAKSTWAAGNMFTVATVAVVVAVAAVIGN